MDTAMNEPLSTLLQVLHAVGIELVIFVLTMILAIVLKRFNINGFGNTKTKQIEEPSSKKWAPSHTPNRSRSKASTTSGRESAGSLAAAPQQMQSRTPAALIDEVVSSSREQLTVKGASRNLGLYAELEVALNGRLISDLPRAPSHSCKEFYGIIMQSAIRAGKHNMLDALVDEMSRQAVPRTLDFYESAMKQLAGQKQHQLALQLYDRMVADNLEPSPVTYSCLISFAAEVGALNRAVHFFDKLAAVSTPSIRACMTVLRVHSKLGAWRDSLAVFREMRDRNVPLDSLVLNVVLSTGVSVDQVEGVEALLQEANELSDLISYNTLMKGYAQRSDGVKALQLLTTMRERQLRPNAISFNTCMDALVKSSRVSTAWDLLALMREVPLKPDKFTCSILVKGLTRCTDIEDISGCLQLLEEVGMSCEVPLRSSLYHLVQDAADSRGNPAMVLKVFQQMVKGQVPPNAAAYRQLAQAVGQVRSIASCMAVWDSLLEVKGQLPPPSVFVSVLDALLRQGLLGEAMALFRKLMQENTKDRRDSAPFMQESRLLFIRSLCKASREQEATQIYLEGWGAKCMPNIDCVTGMALAGLQADRGNLPAAWSTIENMLAAGHSPGEVVLHSLIDASCRAVDPAFAKKLLVKAKKRVLVLSTATRVLLVKLFCRCQQVQDAIQVFNSLLDDEHPHLSTGALISVLKLCFQCHHPIQALQLMQRIHGLTDKVHGIHVELSAYKIALSGLADADMLPCAVSLAKEALDRGAELPQDCLQALKMRH
mmetsp:Transcript_31903/g.74646  ORF Transcript_31903/g.74646 Transcript_31903/m.74646 type:complete len:770 (+) Transcript_31903:223-2532(+)